MKKGFLGFVLLLTSPWGAFAQYPPNYGYRNMAPAPYGPGGYPMNPYGQPMPGYGQPMPGYGQPTMTGYAPGAAPMMPPNYGYPMPGQMQPTQSQIPLPPAGSSVGPASPAPSTSAPGSATAESPTPTAQFPTFDTNPLGALPSSGPSPLDDRIDLHPMQRSPERFWFHGSYVPTFMRPGPLKTPLVTTGIPLPFPQSPAAIDEPGTTVVFGNGDLEFGVNHGIKIGAGLWFDSTNTFGIEFIGQYTIAKELGFFISSDANGNPIIGRPIFSTNSLEERAYAISFPGSLVGSTSVDSRIEFRGWEFNAKLQDYYSPVTRGAWLVGFRTARLEESIRIFDTLVPIDPTFLTFRGDPVDIGQTLEDEDRFRTLNRFYGLQLGGQFNLDLDRLSLEFYSKVAVGLNDQLADISGSTTLIDGANRTVSTGGILAQPSNIGKFRRNTFGLLPEAGLNLNYNVLDCVRIKAGYSFLFWNNVTRPGLLIDRSVNSTQVPGDPNFGQNVPGAAAPLFRFRDQHFYMHQFTLGIEIHF